jgi:Flp pilus assembly protein TadD
LLTILLAALSARTFLRNAEYQDAELIWADNVTQRPSNPRAHFNLGYSLLSAGHPEEAAGEFRRAVELEPDYFAAYRELDRALTLSRLQAVTHPDGQTP